MESSKSSVSLMLGHLYPHISTLKSAVQTLTGVPSSFVLPSDGPQFQDTCNRTLVACERKNQLEDFAGMCGSCHIHQTRQSSLGRRNSTSALESVLTAAKRVSMEEGLP